MAVAFDLPKKSGINWTCFSPAADFDPGGSRMGKYVLGGDVIAKNSSGESYLSYADYAVAMVDEIENNKYQQARFTAASDKPEIVFPSVKPVPYYGIFKNTPVYECVKIDALTYFVNFEIAGLKPRTNITLVFDLEQGLVSKVISRTCFDPKYPALCDNNVVFGVISAPGVPIPEKRHYFTEDLVGKRIHWHYSPQLEIIHVYYNSHHASVTFPAGKSWAGIPLDLWNKSLELNPYDEPAWYVKIKDAVAEFNDMAGAHEEIKL
jgi:hypothetical protein